VNLYELGPFLRLSYERSKLRAGYLEKPQESDIRIGEIIAYPLRSNSEIGLGKLNSDQKPEPKMVITCKSCNQEFDSTFSVEDFATLPKEQYESGTLHLCPFCGILSIYALKDYHEHKE
jgi:hypothetical protein